jgi:hypothetical protein
VTRPNRLHHQSRRTAAGAILTAGALLGLVAAGTLANPASAASPKAAKVYHADLEQLNRSGAHGEATIIVKGDQLTVNIEAEGLAPNLVHVQHLHGALAAANECPDMDADTDEDGFVSVLEGVPYYGPIAASLTSTGDTSPAAGLTVSLYPVADAQGRIDYHRTFRVSSAMAAGITDFHIVQHGVDINRNGVYDFEGNGPSDLNILGVNFPFEATAPATCGAIDAGPSSHQH